MFLPSGQFVHSETPKMEATLNEYKDAVKAQVDACTDVSLLDLIFKLLVKSGEENKNNGTEKEL